MDMDQMIGEIYALVVNGDVKSCEFIDPTDGELITMWDFRPEFLRDLSCRYTAFPSGEAGTIGYLSQVSFDFVGLVYDAVKAPKRDKNLF